MGSMILDGIRIIDWTGWVVASSGSARLGALGADIIKIEQKGQGDPQRGLRTFQGATIELPGGHNCAFEITNRNKRSLTLDLKRQEGKEVMARLVAKSDILITNFRHRVRRKLGMEYEDLCKYNQRLVYISATGFGERGPVSDQGSFDPVAQARAGIMMSSGEKDMPPVQITLAMLDEATSWNVVIGALGGLIARDKYGIGQMISTSLFGSAIGLSSYQNGLYFFGKILTPRQNRSEAYNPLWNYYKSGGDKWIYIATPSEKDWEPFCRAMDLPGLLADPRFDSLQKRGSNSRELIAILDKAFGNMDYAEAERRLTQADVPFSPIQSFSELPEDPQVIANEYVTEFDHDYFGKIRYPGSPIEFTKTPDSLRRRAPEYGEHTEEILQEIGYSWDEISTLKDLDII